MSAVLLAPANEPHLRIPGEHDPHADEAGFLELRRKVRDSELLSASVQRLLARVRFHGRLTVIIHDGHILKSGYEEGYFRCKSTL
ncbi:MAG: hypothetical protein ACR2IF_00665 [Terriglobales bacterium]